MKQLRALTLTVACAIAAGMAGIPDVSACNVPVFRYALERWQADTFDVTLYRQGPLPADKQTSATVLQDAADRGAANLTLKVVEVSGPNNFPLPWVKVDFQVGNATEIPPAWQGPFDAATGQLLLNSPARRELVRRLVNGDSVVWVLLDGNPATKSLLDTEFRRLEKEIAIPEVDPNDPRTEGNRALKVAFSVLPVTRADPAETVFIAMLFGIDLSLTNATGPVVFPVYGRGRVLAGFAGKDLNASTISGAAYYVCGACSCEVKAQKPGTDLLLSVNWDEAIPQCVVTDPPLPPLVSLSSLPPLATSVTTSGVPAPAPVSPGGLRRNLFISLAVVLGVVAAGTLVIMRRNRS
ncbi:MAG: hypothetical protein WCS52_12345 [bacterium]